MRLYIGLTKSKYLASCIVVPSIFVLHLINGAQFLNATYVALAAVTAISPLTKMHASL